MAASQPITSISHWTERDRFADYISGFCDGEASFYLGIQGNKDSPQTGIARFVIGLRRDDRKILVRIRDFWGCGQINDVKPNISVPNAKPTSQLRVAHTEDLMRIVVPHFVRHPMYAKKAADFEIWKVGVEFLAGIKARRLRGRHGVGVGHYGRWRKGEKEWFGELIAMLRESRKYRDDPDYIAPEPPPPPATVKPHFVALSLFD